MLSAVTASKGSKTSFTAAAVTPTVTPEAAFSATKFGSALSSMNVNVISSPLNKLKAYHNDK